MNVDYIKNRITDLRLKKGVSEYEMSLALGHSKNYIQNISAGKSLPSMGEFLYMCDYLGITPMEFFDESIDYKNAVLVNELLAELKEFDEHDMKFLIEMAQRMQGTYGKKEGSTE